MGLQANLDGKVVDLQQKIASLEQAKVSSLPPLTGVEPYNDGYVFVISGWMHYREERCALDAANQCTQRFNLQTLYTLPCCDMQADLTAEAASITTQLLDSQARCCGLEAQVCLITQPSRRCQLINTGVSTVAAGSVRCRRCKERGASRTRVWASRPPSWLS